jgi:predicted Zn-dependent protease
VPTWASTHPDPGDRLAKAEQRAASVPTDSLNRAIVNRDPYLQAIDGIVFGENPRQGFFEGARFNHPDLRFRLDFPSGWKTQNTAEAVVAGSPGEDAIIQLTLGGQDTPDALLQKFGQQQGIQMTAGRRETVNGFAASSAEFQAQDQQGTALAGRVMFLAYGGTTYQLLGYSTAAKYGSYANTFNQTMHSFAQLTDQAALSRQPVHLALVRLPRAMTVTEFYRQYPSTVRVEIIAAINGVEGDATLPAGTWAKRVQ